MKRNSLKDKENIPYVCEPRPSLRMTMTTKKKPEKSDARMSVLPLKKQRLSVNLETHQFTESRPSLRTNINLMNTVNTTPLHSCQRSIRKETIINNLVNKLDEEEEIRSIIETKLRRNDFHNEGNSYGPNKEFMYTSEFQPYSSNSSVQVSQKNLNQQLTNLMDNTSSQFTVATNRLDSRQNDESSVTVLSSKLRQCQDELDYFKSIVGEMSKSTFLVKQLEMKILEREQTNSSKTSNYTSVAKGERRDSFMPSQHDFQENYVSNSMTNTNRCSNCGHCKCGGSNMKKSSDGKLVDVDTQTDLEENQGISYKVQETSNYEFDFFDNLDRTLKILSNSKNL